MLINADTRSSERQGLRTSNLVHGWRTTTRISHRRHDLQGQRSRSQGHVISLSRLGPMLYVSLEACGDLPCRPNPAATLLLYIRVLFIDLHFTCIRHARSNNKKETYRHINNIVNRSFFLYINKPYT